MKIRLTAATVAHGTDDCMNHWFTSGRAYEAVEGKTIFGKPGYTLETDQGYPDTFTATYFDVVDEAAERLAAGGAASRFEAETNRRVDGE